MKKKLLLFILFLISSGLLFGFFALPAKAQTCVSHSYKQCFNSDVYWFDSCGNKESMSQYCGVGDWSSSYQCSGNWLQRQWVLRGCANAVCYTQYQWNNYQDCGFLGQTCQTNACSSSNLSVYCYASPNPAQTRQTTTFSSYVSGGTGNYTYTWSGDCSSYVSTCNNSFSTAGTYTATLLINSGSQTKTTSCQVSVAPAQQTDKRLGCYNNDLYWFDYYWDRQELYQKCGTDYCETFGQNYCLGGAVYQQRTCYRNGCGVSSCYSNSYTESRLVEQCALGQFCQNGKCQTIQIGSISPSSKPASSKPVGSRPAASNSVASSEQQQQASQNQTGKGLSVSILEKKAKDQLNWLKSIKATSAENIDFLIIVNNTENKSLDNVVIKVSLPSDVIYKRDLQIDGKGSSSDIREGVNIGTLPAEATKVITFKGQIAAGAALKPHDVVVAVNAAAGNLSSADSLKISLQRPFMAGAFLKASVDSLVKSGFWLPMLITLVIFFFAARAIKAWFFAK